MYIYIYIYLCRLICVCVCVCSACRHGKCGDDHDDTFTYATQHNIDIAKRSPEFGTVPQLGTPFA